jgi:hypothetical protein
MNQERREKAIAWINEEIRSLELAPELNGCQMTQEWATQMEIMRTCLEAVQDHFREVTKMVKLTLEQLREMDGRPVWVEDLEKPEKSGWRLIYWDRGKYLVLLSKSAAGYILEEYGKTWIAYSYQPANIDREAWKPCGEMCRNNCATCDHNADELFGDADYCKDCHRYSKWESSIHKYCERCGRPRTPEALAELEKRLRG